MKRLILAAILLAAAPIAALSAQNWDASVTHTERGYKLGNPQAPVKLIAFISYSCPHCAHFEQESDAPLRLTYIQPGKATLEVRNVLRNPLDLAAALTAECGPDDKFFGNMRAIFRSQDKWMQTVSGASQATMNRWTTGPLPARMRAIADDLDFYQLMEPRGYSTAQLDQCLGDQKAIDAIVARFEADTKEFAITGTPSFAVNGKLLDGVHTWDALQSELQTAASRR